MTADDGTYFWPESDGWRVACGSAIIGPFKSFDGALQRWRLIQLARVQIDPLTHFSARGVGKALEAARV